MLITIVHTLWCYMNNLALFSALILPHKILYNNNIIIARHIVYMHTYFLVAIYIRNHAITVVHASLMQLATYYYKQLSDSTISYVCI